MPGVDLASDCDELLWRSSSGFESLDNVGLRLRREEAHLVALRIRRDLSEWVTLDDPGQLGFRPHDHVDIEPEGALDLRFGTELPDPFRHRVTHDFERRAAEEGRREVDAYGPVLDADVTDDAEVDERDDRDLRIRDLGERLPDLLGGYHVVPAGCERRTIVISSQSSVSSGECSSRPVPSSGRSSSSAFVNRGSSSKRSNHICACMRWYASSRSILAASPAISGSPDCFSCSSRCASACSYR